MVGTILLAYVKWVSWHWGESRLGLIKWMRLWPNSSSCPTDGSHAIMDNPRTKQISKATINDDLHLREIANGLGSDLDK